MFSFEPGLNITSAFPSGLDFSDLICLKHIYVDNAVAYSANSSVIISTVKPILFPQ